jgi:hypothetical protein
MKKFNINDYMYVQITERGWKELIKKHGEDFVNHCIKSPGYVRTINGKTWYRLQCHFVIDMISACNGFINSNVMFDDDAISDLMIEVGPNWWEQQIVQLKELQDVIEKRVKVIAELEGKIENDKISESFRNFIRTNHLSKKWSEFLEREAKLSKYTEEQMQEKALGWFGVLTNLQKETKSQLYFQKKSFQLNLKEIVTIWLNEAEGVWL